jgi:hypothetical protein
MLEAFFEEKQLIELRAQHRVEGEHHRGATRRAGEAEGLRGGIRTRRAGLCLLVWVVMW